MRSGFAPVLAAGLLALAAPAQGLHGETCSAAGAQPALEVGGTFAFAGVLTPDNGFPSQGGRPHKWTLALPSGEHYLAMESTEPWPVFAVCEEGQPLNRHLCYGPAFTYPWFPSTCMMSVSFSGPPIFCGSGGCKAVIYVVYCMGTLCGYPADVPVVAYAGAVV